jgi:hypothetical protein
MSRVADGEHHVVTGSSIRDLASHVGIKRHEAGLDREHAADGHGVTRIDPKLMIALSMSPGLAGVRRQPQRDGDLLAERPPQQLNCAVTVI